MPAAGEPSEGAGEASQDTVLMPQGAQPSEGDTVKMLAVEEGAGEQSGSAAGGTDGSDSPPPTILPPPSPPSGPYPWKWILIIGLACVVLAIGAGAALAFVTGSDNKTSSTASTATTTSTSSTRTSTKSNTTTGRTTTSTTQTTSTSASSKTKAYIAAMDKLVAQNAELEKQIGVAADQINKVAPAGITDAMLADIDRLGIKFLAINTEAQDLEVPTAFSQAHKDFLQLTSYNMTRCDAIFGGALSWTYNQPYQEQFAEGQAAKVSYQALYPKFEDEYGAAKSPLQ